MIEHYAFHKLNLSDFFCKILINVVSVFKAFDHSMVNYNYVLFRTGRNVVNADRIQSTVTVQY